ncbi:hypothetical protein MRX96_049507 [Rhipicephalus microplus]
MPLFPGHRYLGPGNTLHNGDPLDEDDGMGKSHDEAYERATSHEDVFAADKASAALLFNDFRHTNNWHSALGSQIQQAQSDTSLTQAPVPEVSEVTVKVPQNSFKRFCPYLTTTECSQCSVTAKYSPHGPMQC